jgi:amino acid transporter
MAEKKDPSVVSVKGQPTSELLDVDVGEISYNVDHLQRHLGNRQIQLIAIGGSIGTALFVRYVAACPCKYGQKPDPH